MGNITIWLVVENIFFLSMDKLKGISNEWFIRTKSWWRFFKWGCEKSEFIHRENSIVKCAWARVVLGWVTSWEIPMLHLCEHHLGPMSAKCSIYSHETWIHVSITTHDIWVNEFDSKTTQLNPNNNTTIWFVVENISYLSIDELKGFSNDFS